NKELKTRRLALGLTQEQLAVMLGIAANTVARWERGERGIPPILPLALETIERREERHRPSGRPAAGPRTKAKPLTLPSIAIPSKGCTPLSAEKFFASMRP